MLKVFLIKFSFSTRFNNQIAEEAEEDMEIEQPLKQTTISDDGVFKVSIGPSTTTQSSSTSKDNPNDACNVFIPSPRMNCGLAVKHGILYLYGGMFEDGDKQITFNDFYTIDLKKIDEWKTIIADDQSQEWLGSDSESEEEVEDEETEEDESDSDNAMDTV